jgi:hypothetical protein
MDPAPQHVLKSVFIFKEPKLRYVVARQATPSCVLLDKGKLADLA